MKHAEFETQFISESLVPNWCHHIAMLTHCILDPFPLQLRIVLHEQLGQRDSCPASLFSFAKVEIGSEWHRFNDDYTLTDMPLATQHNPMPLLCNILTFTRTLIVFKIITEEIKTFCQHHLGCHWIVQVYQQFYMSE